MLSSKSKSGISDASINKSAPATPKTSKLGRAGSTKAGPDSPSPQQPSRLSVDRSPRSVDSKLAVERRFPKISTPPDKQLRTLKGLELQPQLVAVQEELKKEKEKLVAVEKEKSCILEELKDAKKAADEANEKLQEALVAQKRAEEASELDKFRADELEQASIEANQKREEEWQKEQESTRSQHAIDVGALLATTQELQRVKQELAMMTETKNTALSHADDAMKIAEINADKVELLYGEINQLKILLDSAVENKSNGDSELVINGVDLQGQLTKVQEDLKKANQKLTSTEKEKIQILEELKNAKRLAEEANEKLKENLDAQKRANEALEIDKIRISELEKESIKAAQKREEEWQKELESIKNKNAVNVAKLLSMREELERVSHELAMTTDAKNTALSHANEAMKIAETNAEKVKLLSEEVGQLKASLDTNKELEAEVLTLRASLEKANDTEKKIVEMEAFINGLRTEVNKAKKSESDASQLADEWKKKAELLEVQLEEANQSRKSSVNALASVTKQLEESNAVLQDKECEVDALKGKVYFLEFEVSRHKSDLEESSQHLDVAQWEVLEMGKALEGLKSELHIMEEEKSLALDSWKLAVSKIQNLTEERNKLISELETTRYDAENIKKAMEGLALALHEMSLEAREAQCSFMEKKSEVETAHAQIEELKLAIMKNKESYEVVLKEAKHEIVSLQKIVERFEREVEASRSEWELKELDLVGAIKRSEEEIAAMKGEMDKIIDSLKGAECDVKAAKEYEIQLMNNLKHLEFEACIANKAAEEANAEALHLREMLLDKENELQGICQENDNLRIRETEALNKVKEISLLLDGAKAMKPEENGELLIANEKQPNILIVADSSLENIQYEDELEKPKSDVPSGETDEHNRDDKHSKEEKSNGNAQEEEPLEFEGKMPENGKMAENGKIMDKDLTIERDREAESYDDESDTKVDGSSFDQTNGLTSENIDNGENSPTRQQQQQKKKKALIQKFGSLLKKKRNHK